MCLFADSIMCVSLLHFFDFIGCIQSRAMQIEVEDSKSYLWQAEQLAEWSYKWSKNRMGPRAENYKNTKFNFFRAN